jgi:hypothetical protein
MACACLRSTSWSGWVGAVERRPNPPGIGGQRSSTATSGKRGAREVLLWRLWERGPGLRRGFGTVTSTLPCGREHARAPRLGRPTEMATTESDGGKAPQSCSKDRRGGEGAADLPRYTGYRHGTHRPSAPIGHEFPGIGDNCRKFRGTPPVARAHPDHVGLRHLVPEEEGCRVRARARADGDGASGCDLLSKEQ